MEIVARPLDAEAFAPFGQVFGTPARPERIDLDLALVNHRSAARPTIALIRAAPVALPFETTVLERHRFSSQTFVPARVARYLVVVAPGAVDGGPDLTGIRAFVATGGQGVNYVAGTWHHGLTVLDAEATFTMVMWNDGSDQDTEFVTLPETLVIRTADS